MEMLKLFANNLRILGSFLPPEVVQTLQNEHFSEVTISKDNNNNYTDLIIQQQSLYSGNLTNEVKKQLTRYFGNPDRYYFNKNVMNHIMQPYARLRTEGEIIRKALADDTRTYDHSEIRQDLLAGYCVVFGLGAGLHLPSLVEKLNFKDLIICEGYLDFLHASMQIINWEDIANIITRRGGRIHFIIEESPQKINLHVTRIIQKRYPELIEGSYLYQHHTFGPIPEAIQRFNESKYLLIQYNGWLEDELRHLRSITGNILNNGIYPIIDAPLNLPPNKPVIVIGSGPSISANMTDIKKIRDKVILITSGSALRVLLSADITPDFHCELENSRILSHILEETAAEFDLSEITFLSSTTTPHKTAAYFKKCLYFTREGDAAPSLFSTYAPAIPFSGRTATLSALAICMYWKVQNIFLLGTDFAQLPDGTTHAKNTIYDKVRTDGIGYGQGSASEKNMVTVPGNFRESVTSTVLWTFMRQGIEQVIQYYKEQPFGHVYNLSDGARIEGATPCSIQEFVEACETISPTQYQASLINDYYQRTLLQDLNHCERLQDISMEIRQCLEKLMSLETQLEDTKLSVEIENIIADLSPANEKSPFSISFRRTLSGSLQQAYHFIRFKLLRTESQHINIVEDIIYKNFVSYFSIISVYFLVEIEHLIEKLDDIPPKKEASFLKNNATLALWYQFYHAIRKNPNDALQLVKGLSNESKMWMHPLVHLRGTRNDDRIDDPTLEYSLDLEKIENEICSVMHLDPTQVKWWYS